MGDLSHALRLVTRARLCATITGLDLVLSEHELLA